MYVDLIRVAGVSFYPEAVAKVGPDSQITLIREPENPYDPNAVRVDADGVKIGYIPRGRAEKFAAIMASGVEIRAVVYSTGRTRPDLPIGVTLGIRVSGDSPRLTAHSETLLEIEEEARIQQQYEKD